MAGSCHAKADGQNGFHLRSSPSIPTPITARSSSTPAADAFSFFPGSFPAPPQGHQQRPPRGREALREGFRILQGAPAVDRRRAPRSVPNEPDPTGIAIEPAEARFKKGETKPIKVDRLLIRRHETRRHPPLANSTRTTRLSPRSITTGGSPRARCRGKTASSSAMSTKSRRCASSSRPTPFFRRIATPRCRGTIPSTTSPMPVSRSSALYPRNPAATTKSSAAPPSTCSGACPRSRDPGLPRRHGA